MGAGSAGWETLLRSWRVMLRASTRDIVSSITGFRIGGRSNTDSGGSSNVLWRLSNHHDCTSDC